MAQYKPKAEVLIDLSQPAEELKQVITAITASHQVNQLAVMMELHAWLGDVIEQIEAARKPDLKRSEKPQREG